MACKLAYMLRTYRTCNSMVGFSKYEFYNKLLGGITLLRVTHFLKHYRFIKDLKIEKISLNVITF